MDDNQIEQLSQVLVTGDSLSHLVFTSGSTGSPKAVQLRHRNFMSYMNAHFIRENDIILQLASCSFDVHLDEIISALVRGAHLVLLKSGGSHLDLDYVTRVIHDHHVTFIAPVPSWIDALCRFLQEKSYAHDRVKQVHWWFIGGEQLLSSTVRQLLPYVNEECHILNSYGPAEITESATCYDICRDKLDKMMSIPIGRPLAGYTIYIVDEYRELVVPGEQGEIVIGGVGVFAGYCGRKDLSEEVLIDVNGERCYMSGDFGRLDMESGDLIFIGRRDYQVKLRGQRIELGQIEYTIMQRSSLISCCIVTKYIYREQEHLIAYVETMSNTVKEEELLEQCLSCLPSYMVPSMLIILQKFPLSCNGKIDRKALPSPDFTTLHRRLKDDIEPLSSMEVRVHELWCEVLHMEHISIKTSFFALHGTSLLFMRLYSLYQIEFGTTPDIVACLQQASIIEHAQLLTKTVTSTPDKPYQAWSCLHIDHTEASFAQSRIFLDEQMRFQSSNDEKTIAIYNLPMLCRLSKCSVSVERFRQTLRRITDKHAILRTCVRFDAVNGRLTQYIQPNDVQDWFDFNISIINNDNELKTIFHDEATNRTHFDVNQGRVFRCHIVRQQSSTMNNDNDFLFVGDWIIFNFHHIAFDGESEQIFLNDLYEFYNHEQLIQNNNKQAILQYTDYSIQERQIDMTAAKIYWRQTLKEYQTTKSMALPFDRKLPLNSIYTGQGLAIDIYLSNDIVKQLIEYASHFNATLYQVCLTIYYIFLCKLTGGQRDIIVGIVQANRYRLELRRIIGMFVNTLPIRIHIDPQDTFEQVLYKVKTMIFETQPHSNLPYQYIIEQLPMKRLDERNFIQTMFTLNESQTLSYASIIEPYSTHYSDDHAIQIAVPINAAAMFDMELSMEYTAKTHSLRTELTASSDLFDLPTLITMARRFQVLIEQLFSSTPVVMSTLNQSICDMSVILSEEITNDRLCLPFKPIATTNSIGRASFSQMRSWYDEQINYDSKMNNNNISFFYQITNGFLSIKRLRCALRLVVLKHSSLRASLFFDSTSDCLLQRITIPKDDQEELFIFTENTLKMSTDFGIHMFDELCNVSDIDVSSGCVFYVHIFKQENDNTDLLQIGDFIVFNFHQSAFDISSMNIFCRDLSLAYECETLLSSNDTEFRYIDYAIAEPNFSMKVARTFWHETMFDFDWNQHIVLPTDRQRSSDERRTGRVYTVSSTFDNDLAESLINYAVITNFSLLHLFLTCYYVFLFKLVHTQTDLCVGMYVNSRYEPEMKNMVGCFMNLIPLRFQLNPTASFQDCLHRVAKLCQKSIQYGHFPYQCILQEFALPPTTFLDISFDFQTNCNIEQTINTIELSNARLEQITHISTKNDLCNTNDKLSIFDLSLTITYDEQLNTLAYTIHASSDLFNQATIQQLSHRFHTLTHQLFSSHSFNLTTQPIYQLSILLPIEINIIQQFNNTNTTSNHTIDCIHQAFIHQAITHPHKIAVTLDNHSFTYAQLLTQVQQVASSLINDYDVQPGDIICQCIHRSIHMIIGIMSIMMCGGVYAPLNPNDPFDRLQSLVHQVNPKIILINQLSPSYLHQLNVSTVDINEIIDDNINHTLDDNQIEQLSQVLVTGDSLSHLVFTSGSTGSPKAVQLRHRNFMSYMNAHFIRENDIILQLASCSFDVHLDEIISALVRGAHLVLLKSGGSHLDLDYVTRVIHDHHVTFIAPVPSWIDALCRFLQEKSYAHDRVKQVHWWFIGGEQLLSSTVRQLLPYVNEECHILNSYGPAEITESATCYDICRDKLDKMMSIPIGRPLAGYTIYIVDEYRELVVPGEQGEIVIGGVGVFAGYHGRKDLSEEVLIDVNGERCYVSGDFGRLDMESGELMFVGRRDHQVKLRGQRIELAVIESIIFQTSSDILYCIVMKEKWSNDSYLTAYIKIKEDIDKNNIQDKVMKICRSRLPSYMVPSKWFFVSEFPLNANGKIDRHKLSHAVAITGTQSGSRPLVTLSPLEKKLEDIFIRAFGLKPSPDVLISFGQLGGTSLGAIHALILIRQEIFEQMDISLLFANPSIQQLATVLKPLLTNMKFVEEKEENDENFSVRPVPSWLIETLGILVLTWQWLWPLYIANQLDICFFSLLLIPFMHLLQYPMFMKLLGGPFPRGRDTLYSWRYYRLWFLRRQWSLNTYWLGYLLGTPFYNAYLRLCGARIHGTAYIYTSQIDAPWLIEIGNNTYIGEEVVLSSLTYHDCIYDLHEIHIGSHCSIETRSVLYDRVDMHDRVFVAPLTAITGRIFGNNEVIELSCNAPLSHSIFQFVIILVMIYIHSIILKVSWSIISWLPVCLSMSLCWLIWSIVGAATGLFFLRFVVGNIEENFSYPLTSWPFLHRFWLRHLILRSFGPCFSNISDGFNSFTPSILRWLGATIEDNNIEIVNFVPFLAVPSNLLIIRSDVTATSEICLVPFDVTVDGQCVVTGRIEIQRRSFLGNNCILRSGVSIPEDVLIGSLTRIDVTTIMTTNDILLGIPAQSMPFILSDADTPHTTVVPKQRIIRKIFDDFQRMIMEFAHFILLGTCVILSLMMTSSFNQFLLVVPIFLLIYSFLILAVYVHLMANELYQTRNNQSFDEINTSWKITLAMTLFINYTKYIGNLLGGTQWLIIVLRRFGAHIDDDVIIDDMNSLYDVHLITIGSHVRLSSTCQIQCHTFEQRLLKLRPVKIGSACIFQPMSFVLAGVEFIGYNRLAPCSLALPHDRFLAHTDWSGSPTKRTIVHHGAEPPRMILAEQQSSIDTYNVIVARTDDDILTLYFGQNGWMSWQSGLNLRQPFRPYDIYIKLFFASFLCNPTPRRVLIIGLGGGIWPMLIRHYFPSVIVDVVEIDKTVIALARDFFGLAEQSIDNYFNIFVDDGCHYVSETAHRYDMIFIDAFLEDAMPSHMNTRQFFVNLHHILNDDGCLTINANVPTTVAYNRIVEGLSSIFKSNILLAHNNTIENARVIISGNESSLASISSRTETIRTAERLEIDAHFEFSLARLISLAYRGLINERTLIDFNGVLT